ncbi:rod shape-determining protein MreD [Thalassotalea ponticola]|uniref:rod shape-determining protein MreD n=1 Tax=Thalassotalea ponticola TaxID=1523392 RepID=UPI0025B4C6E1|nr:rod shape-determining protein MreD [Thalassotalea ponticola]MDN3653500.1 rod shape-determining protein MreD [Thalassotalea ponticola]
MKAKSNNYIIVITLVVSLLLTILPMPIEADSYRPNWTLLVLVYWSLALPNRVNVLYGWFFGFVIDVLLGSVLGIHAFASALVVYISANNYQKVRNFSLWQQSLIVALLVALYHLVVFWLQRFLFEVDFSISYLKPVISSTILWFVIFLLLRKIRRHFKVH